MTKVIKSQNLTKSEMCTVLSLQGLVNRKEPLLFIEIDNYLTYLQDEFEYINFLNSLKLYRDFYKGCISFEYTEGAIELNIASTISACKGYLIIPNDLYYLINELNIIEIINIDNLTGDYIDKQEKIFNEYKDLLNKDGLIHQVCVKDNYHLTLRDHGISKKWFTFYTGEDDKAKSFRKKVLEWANKNIAIYGWTTDEIDFVDDISKYGDYVIPSDWSCNHSYLDKFDQVSLKQRLFDEIVKPNKHYLTICVSDGDNVQWLERDFAFTSTFGQRMKSNMNYPISWTLAPSLAINTPNVVKYLYNLNKNDYFVSGVSGAGYMNPCAFPKEYLAEFCNRTAKLMKNSDLQVVTLLDNLKNKDKIIDTISEYALHEEIIGGIYEMDPLKYEGGKGEVFWSKNGKPFASVRVSFWSPDGSHQTVTNEWINDIANKINNFPIDNTSIDGYTVLNVHPWSTTIEDLDKLISKLDDHIQIIHSHTFLKLMKEKVKH